MPVAAPSAAEVMKQQVSPEYVAVLGVPFPEPTSETAGYSRQLKTDVIDCEGEQLVIVPLKSTDPSGTTCLHVPTLDLIAAGDAAYNGVHPRLVESNQNHKNDEWLVALEKMQSLKPRAVVAGHKNPKEA